MEINFIILIFLSYLIGSIPFAFLLTSLFGYGDIRKIGSGNIGATNVLRTGKKSLAILVLILDIAKGFIPIAILSYFYKFDYLYSNLILIGSFAIIGHIFPIWLIFKGGKGVSTYTGFILGIDYKLGIIFILFWLIITFLKRYASLSSISALIVILLSSIILGYNIKIIYILTLLTILIIIKHRANIKRLLNGSENKIKF
jgi:glycerol-3-phosphate acyltransferase PlsY